MRTIVTDYPIWNLWIQRPFTFNGYDWQPFGGMAGYAELTRQLLATPEDVRTVTVTRTAAEGAPAVPAVLWDSGSRLDDYLLLCAVGQGRNVHYREAAWRMLDGETEVEQGRQHNYTLRGMAFGERAVSPFEIEAYLTAAEPVITQPGWATRTGYNPAAFWYLASLNAHPLDQRFLSAWAGLDLLTQREQGGGDGEGEAAAADPEAAVDQVRRWRDAHGFDWLTDDFVDRWTVLREDCALRRPDQRVFTPRHASIFTRKLQWCLLLALLEMTGFGGFARRESVLRDIRR